MPKECQRAGGEQKTICVPSLHLFLHVRCVVPCRAQQLPCQCEHGGSWALIENEHVALGFPQNILQHVQLSG